MVWFTFLLFCLLLLFGFWLYLMVGLLTCWFIMGALLCWWCLIVFLVCRILVNGFVSLPVYIGYFCVGLCVILVFLFLVALGCGFDFSGVVCLWLPLDCFWFVIAGFALF